MKLCAWPGNEALARSLGALLGAPSLPLQTRSFPDGESYLRVLEPCRGERVAIVATLDRPNDKALPLLMLADALREQGARDIGLIAPYLAYLRQDRQFSEGEAVTSRSFGSLVSRSFNWLVTVDPHLHRYKSLSEIYALDGRVVHAAPAIAAWVKANVSNPVLIGPDEESAQWVGDIAARIGAPSTVLQKTRKGDREVEVSIPHLEKWPGRTPVLADDIISTARTMIAAVWRLRESGAPEPVCVGVHAVFAGDAYAALQAAAPARIVTCNTIAHASNAIDLAPLIAAAVPD